LAGMECAALIWLGRRDRPGVGTFLSRARAGLAGGWSPPEFSIPHRACAARFVSRAEDHKENLMPAFPGVDFLDFDSLLNDEELLARKTARQFVDEQVIPIIEKHNREAKFPMELVPQLGALGFFGANLKGYGCAEMSNVAYGLVMQELERGDSGLRSFVSVQSALVMYPIHTYGSSEQKDKWLPRMQSGKALGCFGLT